MQEHLDIRHEIAQKLSGSLQMTIRLLQMNADELSRFINEQAQENPALEYAESQALPVKSLLSVKSRFNLSSSANYSRFGVPLENVSRDGGERESLERQLRLCRVDEVTLRVGLAIIRQLDANGYFRRDISSFARENGVSKAIAGLALITVQSLDPPGIASANLSECLNTQLERMGITNGLCNDIVKNYLREAAKRDFAYIASMTGESSSRVREAFGVIRSLNPKPCDLSSDETEYIVPDFSVNLNGNGSIDIEFIRDYYPSVRIDEAFAISTRDLTGEDMAFAKNMLSRAKQIVRAVDLRTRTLEKLAKIIVREQAPFFRSEFSLFPLRCADVANELGVHQSTVYRAIQGKYLVCDRGTYPLCHFFQRAYGAYASAQSVKDVIRELTSGERRVTDREISAFLASRGIKVSRRTISKYRSQMRIPPRFERRA